MTHGQVLESKLRRYRRFYVSVILYDLICERDVEDIIHWSGASRGELQSLQNTSASFAACLTKFCDRYGWQDFRVLFSQFIERINSGVKADLVDLVRIPYVKRGRARALHKAGFKTVEDVAKANPQLVAEALRRTSRGRDEEHQLARLSRIVLAGARELKSKDGIAAEQQLRTAEALVHTVDSDSELEELLANDLI